MWCSFYLALNSKIYNKGRIRWLIMFGEDVFSEYEEIVIVHTTNKELENKIKEFEFNRSISFGSNRE